MKKLAALALGLGLVLGSVSFAQDSGANKMSKKEKKAKKSKKDAKADKK